MARATTPLWQGSAATATFQAMRFTRLRLQNWKNFTAVDVKLQPRTFLVGPNAAGKSNFLDALRFLRDIAQSKGGGLQTAAEDLRPGMGQIRSLHARQKSHVAVEVDIANGADTWHYLLELDLDKRGPLVKRERVRRDDVPVLDRPDDGDRRDAERLRQTHLEQVNANREFRPLVDFFSGVSYLHLVPQLLREPKRFEVVNRDPLGSDFLRRVVDTDKRSRDARLKRIAESLKVAVPNLETLATDTDASGVPHLKGLFGHWRPNAGWQDERQMSDGTLRLIALLWILSERGETLLLEEPELSLNPAVVRELPRLIHRVQKKNQRQVILSTHSPDLLSDEGIDLAEILLVQPTKEGSEIVVAGDLAAARELLESGHTPGEVAMSLARPEQQLLFEL